MSQKVIVRPTITDDSGSGTDGTIFNASFWTDIFNRIDAMVTANYTARTANYTALNTDDFINCTSGSFTITLHAANDSTRSFNPLYIKNSGTGTITIDANSSETIDGELTLTMAPGDGIVLISTGTAWAVF